MGYWRKANEARHRKKAVKRKQVTYKGSRASAYRQCAKKTGYSSQRHAEMIARNVEKERGDKLRVYHCEICGQYHLTKRPHEF